MINKIKNKISKMKEISDWKLKEIEEDSKQVYYIKRKKECEKEMFEKKYLLTIYVDKDDKRGESTVTIQTEEDIEWKIKNAIIDASLGLNPYFTLPESSNYPYVKIKSEKIEPGIFIDKFFEILGKEKGIKPSSLELFQNKRRVRFMNSKGIDEVVEDNSNYFEFVVIAGSGSKEAESHIELTRRNMDHINLEEVIPEISKRAKDTLKIEFPQSGKFNIVISDSEVLSLFSPFIFHSSGEALYKKISLLNKGEEAIKNCELDRLTLIGNSIMDYGNNTYPFDEDGAPNSRKEIVKDGIFKNIWTEKKYADYLGIEPTGSFGNIEVLNGKIPFKELFQDEKPLYHIVEFSAGLWPDNLTGNFAGEIRLGYEIYKGKVRTIKGGSIRGNSFSCFSKALFSKEDVFLGSYKGPKGIKLFDITIAGI